MLSIRNLQAKIEENSILNGINLEVKPGEIHAIMGPNGSGKSTLASVLAGREEFEVTGGSVDFLGKDLLGLSPEERAREGLFLAFQYPVEIPGVSTINFMKSAVNQLIPSCWCSTLTFFGPSPGIRSMASNPGGVDAFNSS